MMEKSHKEIIGAVVVLVIIALFVVFFSGSFFGGDRLDVPSEELRVVNQNSGRNLEAFPEGFPVEDGVEFHESFKYVPANSRDQQSTLAYLSSRTLSENASIFENFFSSNGFEVMNEVEDDGMHFYYARKGNDDLPIRLEDKSGRVLVEVSYLERN